MPRIQAKNWLFTENNPTGDSIQRYMDLECQWLCLCKEHQDDENQTPHIHCAVCFKGRRDINALKKLFPRAHIDKMRGTPQDCKTYLTKEDTNPFEKGEMPVSTRITKEQQKKKWDDAYIAAKEGRFDDIPRDFWIRYQNSFKQIYYDNRKDNSFEDFNDKALKDHFLWLWGPTGTGKSHTAHRIARELGCDEPFLKDLNKWWNGYEHQRVTIIEEADPKRCEYLASYLKKWCDKWAFTAECKGSVINQCRPEYIIITSNYSIDACFPEPSDSDPLHRRMTEICLTRRDLEVQWPETRTARDLANESGTNEFGAESLLVPGNTSPALGETTSTRVEPENQPTQEDPESMIFNFEEPPLKRSRTETNLSVE